MTLELAQRLCELLLGLALMQQSLEHLSMPRASRLVHGARLLLAGLLVAGIGVTPVLVLLLLSSAWILRRCDGPYNGGADRVAVLLQICLLLARLAPHVRWQELALGYLALQITLSYAMAGWVKLVNPAWRNGRALCDVFVFSAYPQSESLRGWARHPRLLGCAGWAVMLFELAFPLSFFDARVLSVALAVAALFHVANACLFGLNRFVWSWIATYPALLWLQARLH